MSDRRDAKLIARSGEGACATTRSTVAAKLDLAERSPVVLSKAECSTIKLALNELIGNSRVGRNHRILAIELLERKFNGDQL
jgi:hypothetical protein